MQAKVFIEQMKHIGIEKIIGVPDSTLKPFCSYLQKEEQLGFSHYVPVNEGAAIGLAMGTYLATGIPACVYMQNSGIGNTVNPITSLAHEAVYGIPMMLLIGWRGEPGTKDESQHKFMGSITEQMLSLLEIKYAIIEKNLTDKELTNIFLTAKKELEQNKQFAMIIKRDTFESEEAGIYVNNYSLIREEAISEIINHISGEDILVSTTGKISREVYEQSERIKGQHAQDFLTVGGMGHASMIALGLAIEKKNTRVYCLDGDGAVLMHMGNMAFIAKRNPKNMVHICFNNEAHESVGGMPTGCQGLEYAKLAKAYGYGKTYLVTTLEELRVVLQQVKEVNELTFVEVRVALQSRADLGRPKESAKENKESFMNYHREN